MDKFCAVAIAVAVIASLTLWGFSSESTAEAGKTMGYESALFDTSRVHTIDIVMDDWDTFIENCESEEYSACAVVIDGESCKNVAIRAKGNTSLSSVRSSGSQRYSFKIEFDHYQKGKTWHGLDKLCLNNLIQDNTMMKDYLVYQLMGKFGVDSPLCSFAFIRVNGEDWGLYLALEGVEDSFLARNYGSDTGDLYKPDSMSFGGGRGNGRDFDFGDFIEKNFNFSEKTETEDGGENAPANPAFGQFPGMPQPSKMGSGEMPQGFQPPEGFNPFENSGGENEKDSLQGFGGFGMGSSDVKLKYIDDDPESYANIFDNAKTDMTKSDKSRLIVSLKKLGANEEIESVVDVEEVIRYFVVHNFVRNGDSYTGAIVHNYYLHEKNGQMAMIPWDYNLAFGTFQSGDASGEVNADIDNPVSGSNSDRPMLNWIFADEQYTEQYHQLFQEFLDIWFSDGQLTAYIQQTADMIRSYVESDPTKFCTTEEFETGVMAMQQFVSLRAEAVQRQLNGDETAVDTTNLNLSAMGSMGGNGGGPGGNMPQMPGNPFSGSGMPEMGNSAMPTAPVAEDGSGFPTSSGQSAGTPPAMPSGNQGFGPSAGFSSSSGQTGITEMPNDTTAPANAQQTTAPETADASPDEVKNNVKPFPDFSSQSNQGISRENVIWLIASTVLLAGGLIFAFCYKRRK